MEGASEGAGGLASEEGLAGRYIGVEHTGV